MPLYLKDIVLYSIKTKKFGKFGVVPSQIRW